MNLAKKLRTLSDNFTPACWQLWDAWWLRRNQADGSNWQNKDNLNYKKHQEILDWSLEDIRLEAHSKYVWDVRSLQTAKALTLDD